jgi:four helix bundle protein
VEGQGVQGSRIQGFKDKGSWDQGVNESRAMLKNYKELKVWQKSYALCINVYKATRAFPNEEKFGLTSQIRRAVVSVVSNIAEGYGRKTTADYVRSLYISYGSLCELETQIMLAGDLNYMANGANLDLKSDIAETERMLKSLIRSLEEKSSAP